MESVINQHHDQLPQAFVSINEDTFLHLPKISKAIGLSTPAMDEVPSKTFNQTSSTKSKGYRKVGCFLHGLDPVEFDPTVDPPPRRCYNCWNMGHLVYDCPKTLTDIFCCNCGRRYVKIEECPRCARLFWDLDESARQWLSSYIPGFNQDDQIDYSKNNYRTADRTASYSGEEDSEKVKLDSKNNCRTVDVTTSYSGEEDSGKVKLNSNGLKREDFNDFKTSSEFIQVTNCKNGSFNEDSKSGNIKLKKDGYKRENLNNFASSTEFIQVRNYERGNFSEKSNSGKLSLKKDYVKREDFNKYESFSGLIQTTNDNRDSESDSDQWWDCCNSKEQSEEEQLYLESKTDSNVVDNRSESMPVEEQFNSVLETKRTKEDYHERLSDDEINVQSDNNLQAANPDAHSNFPKHFKSFGKSLRTTLDEDEDYENIIVDEEEQIEESCVVENMVRDFVVLLKAVKFLPFEQQNKLVLKFVSDCKKKL